MRRLERRTDAPGGRPSSGVPGVRHRRELPPQPGDRRRGARYRAEIGATPAQTALAWVLTRGQDVAPIPGTRRVTRVEENIAADAIELTDDQIQRLDSIEPAAGARHDDANLSTIDR
jgi:aryl-alcohol dehydrogenase-like predicted oxidoreductase